MSTTASTATLDVSTTQRVPFARLVKVELRKSYDTRAGLWLLGITAFLVVVVMVIALVVTALQDSSMTLDSFLSTTTYTSGFLLPVLGIMLVTSEWNQRTGMVTFTLEPHRGRSVTSKLVAGLLLALVVAVLAILTAVVVNAIYGVVAGGTEWNVEPLRVGGFLLGQGIAMLTGFAFAALLLNTAAAIVVYFAYSFIVPTVFAVLAGLVDWFRDIYPWVDFGRAQAPLFDASMSGKDWAHLVVSGMIWLALPLALGFWRILRAEVK